MIRDLRIISIALFILLGGANTHAQSPEDYFHRAASTYIHGDTPGAKKIVDGALLQFPNDEKLQSLKKKMKEEEQQQNQQKQNQDKKDQQKQEQQKQDHTKQDQQQEQQRQDQRKVDEKEQQQAQKRKQQISKQDAERILEALKNEEKDVQKKLHKKLPARVRVEKDW